VPAVLSGTPPAVPDCSGLLEPATETQGHPAWKIVGKDFWIWRDTDEVAWFITPTLGSIENPYWRSPTDNPTNIYVPAAPATGNPQTVNLID
jgi:hypothetical protein